MTDEPGRDPQPDEAVGAADTGAERADGEARGERPARRRLQLAWTAKVTRPVVGWVLLVVGVVALVAGYWGVANEALVAKQLPYLVSGGIGGMVLVAVGAFILGTHDVRQQLARLEELEQLVRELHGVLLVPGGDGDGRGAGSTDGAGPHVTTSGRGDGAAPSPTRPDGPGTGVVALRRGHSYHRPACAMVAGKDVDEVDRATIRRRNLAPCSVCEPELAAAAAGGERAVR